MEKTVNFLNNQRYILGESEKKQIITLFLWWIRNKVLLTFLTYISTFLIWSILLILFIILWVQTFLFMDKFLSFIFFLLFVWNIFLLYISYKSITILKKNKDFFFAYQNNIMFIIINILTVIFLFFYFLVSIGKIIEYMESSIWRFGIIIAIWLILWLIYFMVFLLEKRLLKLNIFHIIISPLVFILLWILYIWTYIFLSTKKFMIIKTLKKQNNLYKDFYEITKK